MTAPTIPADLAAWCSANDARAQDELFAFLRIPSVSARSEHKADCAEAAQFVADALTRIGFTATIEPTPGHPIVVGEWRNAGPDAPTLLVYGHYDVQPADPLNLWKTPAFEPTIVGNRIYGRGAADMKSGLAAMVCAVSPANRMHDGRAEHRLRGAAGGVGAGGVKEERGREGEA